MKSSRKLPPATSFPVRQVGRPDYRKQSNPGVAQPKSSLPAPKVNHPVAPAVYRPQAPPKVLQTKKISPTHQTHKAPPQAKPVAPPVYRPQPVPKVLQRKTSTAPQAVNRPTGAPTAPPVYRPQAPPKVLQTKPAVQQTPPANRHPIKQPVRASAYNPSQAPKILQPKANNAAQQSQSNRLHPGTRQQPPGRAGKVIQRQLILADVPYDEQETEMSCWYASLSMVLGYHNQGIPNYTHTEAYQRGLKYNEGELDKYVIEGCDLGIRTTADDIKNRQDLETALGDYGPMWCPAKQTNHVVVIYGVDDNDNVHYLDPSRGAEGGKKTFKLNQLYNLFPVYLQYKRKSTEVD